MLPAEEMKLIRLIGAVLAASLVLSLDLTATSVHASCLPPCATQLCAGSALGSGGMPSIVTATHDPAVPGVVIVETVLRSGSGPALQPGDQLGAAEPILASHLLVYTSTPPALFPIGDDGFAHCVSYSEEVVPPQGHGATPQAIATLAGTTACTNELSRAGYPIPACNDMPSGSGGCQIGARPASSTWALAVPLAIALAGALTARAGSRSRGRRAEKNSRRP